MNCVYSLNSAARSCCEFLSASSQTKKNFVHFLLRAVTLKFPIEKESPVSLETSYTVVCSHNPLIYNTFFFFLTSIARSSLWGTAVGYVEPCAA